MSKREIERRLHSLETARRVPDNEAAVRAAHHARLADPATSEHKKALIRLLLSGGCHA